MNIEVRGGHCGAQQRWSVVVPHAPEEEIGGAVCRAEVEVEGIIDTERRTSTIS